MGLRAKKKSGKKEDPKKEKGKVKIATETEAEKNKICSPKKEGKIPKEDFFAQKGFLPGMHISSQGLLAGVKVAAKSLADSGARNFFKSVCMALSLRFFREETLQAKRPLPRIQFDAVTKAIEGGWEPSFAELVEGGLNFQGMVFMPKGKVEIRWEGVLIFVPPEEVLKFLSLTGEERETIKRNISLLVKGFPGSFVERLC